VHFSGYEIAAYSWFRLLVIDLSSTCQRTTENGFAADVGSVSGDGRSSRCCTLAELLRDCDLVSVMAGREKCDERGLTVLGVGSSAGPPSAIVQGRLSRKLEKGHTPSYFRLLSKNPALHSSLDWPTRRSINSHKRVYQDRSWSASVGLGPWSPVPKCEAPGAPISVEEHTSMAPRPRRQSQNPLLQRSSAIPALPWPSKPRLRYSPGLALTTRLNALLNAASDS
jgi:hypothetical protein